jgi:capsular polysaccharide biosynthesis protein
MSPDDDEFDVFQLFIRVSKAWYLLILLGLVGAFLGFLASLLQPPIYQATSALSVGLNFDHSEPLSQFEEDSVLGALAGVLTSDDIFESVLTLYASEQGLETLPPDLPRLISMAHIERNGSRWELIIRGSDPVQAAGLANSWAEKSEEIYLTAYQHAIRAADLQTQIETLNDEIVRVSVEAQNTGMLDELKSRLAKLESEFAHEIFQADGIPTFISLEWSNRAIVDPSNRVNSPGTFILVGNLIGLLSGLTISLMNRKKLSS